MISGFKFDCTMCGMCCKVKEGHTTLTYADVIRLSKFIGINNFEFIENYCYLLIKKTIYEGENIEIPQICLKSVDGRCVFLDGKICSVQSSKPFICASFPYLGSIDILRNEISQRDYCKGFDIQELESSTALINKINKNNQTYSSEIEEYIINGFDFYKVFGTTPKEILVINSPEEHTYIF